MPDIDDLIIRASNVGKHQTSVLVIDDNKACFKLFELATRHRDRILTWAETGEMGMRILSDTNGGFDCIVVDENLPDRKGHELIQDIRLLWPKPETVLSTEYRFWNEVLSKQMADLDVITCLTKPLKDTAINMLFDSLEARWTH